MKLRLLITIILLLTVVGCSQSAIHFDGHGESWAAEVLVVEHSQSDKKTLETTYSYSGELSDLDSLKYFSIEFEWHSITDQGIPVQSNHMESEESTNNSPVNIQFKKRITVGESFDADNIKITIVWDDKQDEFYVFRRNN